ncbi:MAG: S-adenosylmethionine:tRNA ribosyltransferase-isomerase [Saprospiraceae bacterium]|nr:S-adenosylmethionine:tRNA ribosyltransferase-isomerase [Saprospiraceae bacterium]
MINPENISISEFDYLLPEERIAKIPLDKRDESKLVIYKNNEISESNFKNISQHLPAKSLLVLNETRVIQARMVFQKESGAKIEIFCLEPIEPTNDFQLAFQEKSPVKWKCFVGNSKKWKQGILRKKISKGVLNIEKIAIEGNAHIIEFSWNNSELCFSDILEETGLVPLPPYMNREAIEADKIRYQTIYANSNGSVAAPTAGLHFTDKVFKEIKSKGIQIDNVTLHVGAGTFKPVIAGSMLEHEMHTEQIFISKVNIQNLIENLNGNIISVGTTTLRTLESLYWFGVKLDSNKNADFDIKQWEPYQNLESHIPVLDSLNNVLEFMDRKSIDTIHGKTQLLIAPGYEFKIANVLITNFHQPKSTLLLLVAAFIGNSWRNVYNYSMKNDFRFLSYGDSCLFFRR